MKLIYDDVNAVNLDKIAKYAGSFANHAEFFGQDAGREHYKLLGWLSMRGLKSFLGSSTPGGTPETPETFVDMGTLFGYSALALALNPIHKVVTYDIADCTSGVPPDRTYRAVPNIEFRQRDATTPEEIVWIAKNASIVLLDIDPHDGTSEARALAELQRAGFKGLLVCDDIHLNSGMQKFWADIALPKWDITHMGHWSGTGLVCYDPELSRTLDIEEL